MTSALASPDELKSMEKVWRQRSTTDAATADDAATHVRPDASATDYRVPDRPLLVLRPGGRWVPLELREIWRHRELLYFLAWRDVQVRYKQTMLGVTWAIMQPLLTMLVFTLFFGRLAAVPSDGVHYTLFAYAGLMPWTFFATAVTASGNSLIGNVSLITKVYFPRIIIPAAAAAAALVDFGISFLMLAALMAYYNVVPGVGIVFLPFLVMLTAILSLGVGLYLSALNVKYRDVRHAIPFLIQLWMFASPIIYPTSLVPLQWRWLMALNPLTAIIEGFRAALFGHAINWVASGISISITATVLTYAIHEFRRVESSFADII